MIGKIVIGVLMVCTLAASIGWAADFPWQVTDLQFNVPAGISYDPKAPIECTIMLSKAAKPTATTAKPANTKVQAGQVQWRVARTRAMPYAQDPHSIWGVDVTNVEEIADGTLPAPDFNKGKTQALKMSFTPGKYGQFSVLLHSSEDDVWYPAAGAAVVYPPVQGLRPLSPFIANGDFAASGHGEFRWLDVAGRYGVKWIRCQFSPPAVDVKNGQWDWSKSDPAAEAYRRNHILMLTGISTFPGTHTPHIGRALITYFAGRKANLIMPIEELDIFSNYINQYMRHYGDVAAALFESNEPWETGSISNYHGCSEYYRQVHKALYTAAHAAKPDCIVLGNDQITNYEDCFAPVPGMDKFIDATSHHTAWSDNRGAVQSAAAGKPAWETEDWSSANDAYVIANLTMKMADGYLKSNPCAEAGYLASPGLPGANGYSGGHVPAFPSTTGQAISTWLHFVEDTAFVRELHPSYLPHTLLFSARDPKDNKNVAVVFGRIKAYGYAYKEGDGDTAWPQIAADGTLKLADADGTLAVYDISGNRLPRNPAGGYNVPLSNDPYYIVSARNAEDTAAKLEAAVADYQGNALRASLVDFTVPLDQVKTVTAKVTNGIASTLDAKATLTVPAGWEITNAEQALPGLKPGETRDVSFAVAKAVEVPVNSYPVTLKLSGPSGTLEVKEDLHVAVFRRGTIDVNGDMDAWLKAGAIPVYLSGGVIPPDVTEQYWYPFMKLNATDESGTICRFAGLWDDNYFYVMAEVNNSAPHYRPPAQDGLTYLMHGKPFDYLYWWGPVFQSTTGDGLKIAFDLFRPGEKNDPWLPPDYQRQIDTRTGGLSADYEYDLYLAMKNQLKESYETVKARHLQLLANPPDATYKTEWARFEDPTFENVGPVLAEVWRLMAPGVPRGNFYPFVPHDHHPDQGLVTAAKLVIKREGNVWRYQAAIPWSELSQVGPAVGKNVNFSFYVENAGKRALSWTANRSACQGGKEILHPTWAIGDAIETPWGFAGPGH